MACLDDETVLGLVEGRLAAERLAAIDEHIDSCDSCRDVVTHVAGTQTAGVIERGTTLGRYVVGDLIGEGAMGRVYSAWEPELDRRVALKVLQRGDSNRLLREAQAMARLDHPNVVGVFEVGHTDQIVYYTMDLVEGDTLRAWAAKQRTWRQIARVLADVARGLAATHAAGVLHRDVKPDNVIVGVDGRARIGDFGLARSGPVVVDGATVIAKGTSIAGTPAYMAPEVLRGGAASEASDQFGFGVTAYEVLAGARPFEGRTWSELLHAVEKTQIARIRDVPSWLDALVRRCLAVDPARRFASLSVIAQQLDANATKRSNAWIAVAAGAALLASGGTWFALRESAAPGPTCTLGGEQIAATVKRAPQLDAPARASIDRWATSWASARDSVCRASSTEPAAVIAARERCLDRRRAELAALLASIGAYGTERLVDALAALPPSECVTLALGAADPLPLDPKHAMLVRNVEAELPRVRAAIALGDARPVAPVLATLVDHARQSGHEPTLAEVLLLQAQAARASSNLPEAATAARDAAAAAERGRDDLAAARAWVERTTIAGDRRDMAGAEDLAALADAAIDRAGSPPHLVAKLLQLRGLVAFNRGELAEAKRLLVEARGLLAERSIEIAAVETSLGAVARTAGDLDAADQHHRNALAIDRELRGEQHPDIARDLHNLAGIERLRNKLAEALALYEQALAIEDATRGEASVQSALTRNSIGLVHMARGEWALAAASITKARDAFRAAGHGDESFAEHNLGLIRLALGEAKPALAHFDRAATLYAATIGTAAPAAIRLNDDRARAIALLARPAKPTMPVVVIEPSVQPTRVNPILVKPPEPAPPPKPKDPTPPTIPDVGVYGSSQGW